MNIPRSVGFSAAVHTLFLCIVFLAGFTQKPAELISETVKIRIRMNGRSDSAGYRISGGSPSESRRDRRRPETNRAPTRDGSESFASTPDPVRPQRTGTVSTDLPALEPETPPVPSTFDSLEAMDPLEGMDFDEKTDTSASPTLDRWSLTWANGRERGILSFPEVEYDAFPETSERLLDVLMSIRVSPQGDVVSAEIVPPGSGDVRIDRYMHNLALRLVLEPRLGGDEVEEATLRLVFQDGKY